MKIGKHLNIFAILLIFTAMSCIKLERHRQINEKFSVNYFESCNCNAITNITDEGGKGHIPLLKNVIEVRGNERTFIVKTSPKQSNHKIWVLFESERVDEKKDYRGLENEELESVLDTLKIDYHKYFK